MQGCSLHHPPSAALPLTPDLPPTPPAVFSSLSGAVDKDKREVGRLAVWSVTSAKPGNGVELLRDGREDTYWQSDGTQPHLVNVQFQKKVFLSHVAIYSDFKLDESYTPNKISIRVGTSLSDLHEVKVVDLTEPQGWAIVALAPPDAPE